MEHEHAEMGSGTGRDAEPPTSLTGGAGVEVRGEAMTRRRVRGVLITLVALPGVACGQFGASQAQEGAASRAPAPEKIVWSTFRAARNNGAWRQAQIERFQTKFPSTKIDLQVLTQDYPKQYALAAAGTLGDVTAWDPSHWVFFDAVKREMVRSIDEYVKRDRFDLGQYYKPFVAYQRWDGKLYGLPSWGWTSQDGIVYNTELAQQAGVTFPAQTSAQWSMQSLYDIVVKVHRVIERTGGYGLSTTLPSATGLTIWCRVFNGDNLSPDGKRSLLLEPQNREALRWIYDLAHKERAVAVPGRLEGNVNTNFVRGQLGMLQGGTQSIFDLNAANADGQARFKALLFPRRKDGKRASQLRGGTWNLGSESTGGRHPDYGWELIKLITDREGMLTFNTLGGHVAFVRPDIMSDAHFQDPNLRVYLENFENAMGMTVPANFRGNEFESTVAKFGDPWYRGEVGLEDGLRTWNTEIQKVLDQPIQ